MIKTKYSQLLNLQIKIVANSPALLGLSTSLLLKKLAILTEN